MPPASRLVASADQLLFDELTATPGDVLLASPFLSYKVCQRLATLAANASGPWRLVTRKDAAAANSGYLSIPGLRVLLEAGVGLEHVDGLHAKAFVVGDHFGLVGSANLTEAGLGSSPNPNIELGVRLNAEDVAATRSIILSWERRPLTNADLDQLEAEAKELAKPPRTRKPTVKATVSNVDRLLADARDGKRALWVKAEYGSRALDRWRTESWFASPGQHRKPGFRPGDLALIYAKGIRACYAVVEVVDEPRFDPGFLLADGSPAKDSERWPWISRTIPRLVPDSSVTVTTEEIGVNSQALRNGHVHISLAGFAAGVRALEGASSSGTEK